MISAASAAAGIRINTAGIVAQTQALAGGSSQAEASAIGAATSLRGSLERDAMAAGATSISSDRRRDIEAQVSELYASELERGQAREALTGVQNELRDTSGGSTGGGGGSSTTQTDYLAALEEEAAFKRSLIGLSSEAAIQEERRRELIEKMTSQGEALTQVDQQRIETLISTEAATRQLIEAEREREAAFDQVAGHIGDAFMAMVDGSKSVEDAFKDMLRNILIDIYESQVIEPMTNNISGLLGGLFSGITGGGSGTQYHLL